MLFGIFIVQVSSCSLSLKLLVVLEAQYYAKVMETKFAEIRRFSRKKKGADLLLIFRQYFAELDESVGKVRGVSFG